jgi:hypothetical protein
MESDASQISSKPGAVNRDLSLAQGTLRYGEGMNLKLFAK